jgi:hypothetical protein
MTLSTARRRAYSFGALAGAFSAVAVLARKDGRRGVSLATAGLALVCGALAVGFEERAQD